ncbi:transglycosylase family protein [Antrihabitans sp. YC2-6]|uniref:transglycosylase family protein n=1 Tax=Antrihabitans sp. YC2-6 TaxID=2799498 RepID=UPI0018F65358|nr:transglycosylase family protein [Antrihabitans sp. YC2-6]MBJ8345379.1 transglycosylase family protein [Antrihabitans sp. YC2-6]
MNKIKRTATFAAAAGALVVAPLALGSGTASAASESQWDAVAACESGGDWSTNTGNGYYGGLQFTESTWAANGGSGSPHYASKAEQIRVAENVLATQGAGAWPSCGTVL